MHLSESKSRAASKQRLPWLGNNASQQRNRQREFRLEFRLSRLPKIEQRPTVVQLGLCARQARCHRIHRLKLKNLRLPTLSPCLLSRRASVARRPRENPAHARERQSWRPVEQRRHGLGRRSAFRPLLPTPPPSAIPVLARKKLCRFTNLAPATSCASRRVGFNPRAFWSVWQVARQRP